MPVTELPTTLAEAHALILALAEERAAIEAENSRIASEMATLTTANADLAAVNQAADARIVELTAIVKMLERTLYGTRSERLRSDKPSDEQIAFAFDEIATGVAAIEAELAKAGGKDKEKRAPRPRKEFGAHLERVEIVIEPEVPPGCEADPRQRRILKVLLQVDWASSEDDPDSGKTFQHQFRGSLIKIFEAAERNEALPAPWTPKSAAIAFSAMLNGLINEWARGQTDFELVPDATAIVRTVLDAWSTLARSASTVAS